MKQLSLVFLSLLGVAIGWFMPDKDEDKPPTPTAKNQADTRPPNSSYLNLESETLNLPHQWPPTKNREGQIQAAMKWAETDPAAALTFFADDGQGGERDHGLAEKVADYWATTDPAAFLGFLNGNALLFRGDSLKVSSTTAFCNHLAAQPAAAEAYWTSLALPSPLKGWLTPHLTAHLLATDPQRAMAFTATLPPGLSCGTSPWNQVREVKDPEPFLKEMLRTGQFKISPWLVNPIFEGLIRQDMGKARELWATLPAGVLRQRAGLCIINAMAAKDPQGAEAWMTANCDTQEARHHLAEILAKQSPDLDATVASVRVTEFDQVRHRLEIVAADRAKHDWQAGLSFVGGLPSQESRNRAVQGIVQGMDFSPAGLSGSLPRLAELMELRSSPIQTSSLTRISPESGPQLAAWLAGQPPQVREPLLEVWSIELRDNGSPAQAAAFLQNQPPGPRHTQAVSDLVEKWTASEPKAAAAFVQSLPDGPAKVRGMAALNSGAK